MWILALGWKSYALLSAEWYLAFVLHAFSSLLKTVNQEKRKILEKFFLSCINYFPTEAGLEHGKRRANHKKMRKSEKRIYSKICF